MSVDACPKCNFSLSQNALECPSCGIVLSKITDRGSGPDQQVVGNSQLVSLWKDIVSNYEDQDLHDLFIQESLRYKKLNFASQQYRKMIEVNPMDETAKKMQEKIIQIATIQMDSLKSERKFEKPPKWTTWGILMSSMALFFGTFAGKPMVFGAGFLSMAVIFGIRIRRK